MNPVVIVDVSRLIKSLDAVERKGKTLGPVFRGLRKEMRGDQKSHAEQKVGPDGAWPARSKATEDRRKARNRGVRRFAKASAVVGLRKSSRRSTPKAILGRLPKAVVVTSTPLSVKARSRASFGGSHNQGDRVGRRRRVNLPRRQFLWLSDALIEQARRKIEDALVEAFRDSE